MDIGSVCMNCVVGVDLGAGESKSAVTVMKDGKLDFVSTEYATLQAALNVLSGKSGVIIVSKERELERRKDAKLVSNASMPPGDLDYINKQIEVSLGIEKLIVVSDEVQIESKQETLGLH
jgi:hypothetical protein